MDRTKIMVYFKLYADVFPIETVTERLGISPTRSFKKGDIIKRVSKDLDHKRDYSAWIVSTGYQESLDVGEVLEQIMLQLQHQTETINELKREFELECRFAIVIEMNDGYTPGFHLNLPVIEFANSIGADFDIDLYANPYLGECGD
ncbi:DUF4279 domain-containing protein [Cytobacillus gottheilii]|uniref:DUF4279 domain-containing protein n=1 Tax=Cytobacillus gottheilii TaxID=859144 RepID=UPI0009BBFB4B|nr:DUF4279 domain-containing protein [Cytobacillus gottheilii]